MLMTNRRCSQCAGLLYGLTQSAVPQRSAGAQRDFRCNSTGGPNHGFSDGGLVEWRAARSDRNNR
jgi:hypothetical protein